MTTDAYEDSNFEELLLSNDFYSSNTSSSHMSTFRDSMQLKSPLSPALSFRGVGETEKTNIMRNSPSMKALEKILNEKSRKKYEDTSNVIEEEEEEEHEEEDDFKDTPENVKGVRNKHSMVMRDHLENVISISKDSDSSGHYSDARTHTTESESTFSRKESNEYNNEEYAIRSHSKAYNNIDASGPGVFTSMIPDDQDDTLIEENFPSLNSNNSKHHQLNPEAIPQKYTQKTTSMIPDDIDIPTKKVAPKYKDLPPIANKSLDGQKLPSKNTETIPSPRHTRSNSTFSLSFKKEVEEKPSTRHKRSSTLGDLTAVNNNTKNTSAPKEKKRFSFKSLFKAKPKAKQPTNEKLHQDERSEPNKLNSKSFSTPNISRFNNSSTTVSDTKSFASKTNKKIEEKNNEPKMTKENTLLNVFKKNKSVEGFTFAEKLEEKPEKPTKKNTRMSTWIDNNFINTSKPLDAKSVVSNDVNFIREVNDTTQSEEAFSQKDEYEYDSKNLIVDPPTQINNTRIGQEMELLPNPSPEIIIDDKQYSLETQSPTKLETVSVPDSSKELQTISKSTSKENNDEANTKVNDQLLGEALFPKSLSQQEVESIVSLERSRSVRSVKSNKRNSFINYNGSDENIIVYNGDVLTPSKGISRSGSILKNSKMSLNVNDESNIMKIDDTLDSHSDSPLGLQLGSQFEPKLEPKTNIPPGQAENDEFFENYEEFLEFSDFIDLDNLSFSTSPIQLMLNRNEEEEEDAPDLVAPSFMNSSDDFLNANQNQVIPDINIEREQVQEQQNDDSGDFSFANAPLTPNLEVIEAAKFPTSPESPINRSLGSAYENTPVLNEHGNSILNNRPISMSFKGLRGPSFGDSLAQHDIRSSDSHQSFNISFGEDDTDYSSSVVGGGFGTSEDEDDEEEEDGDTDDYSDFSSEDKENISNNNPKIPLSQPSKRFGSSNSNNVSSALTPPRSFKHNKMPSFSDNSNLSSPISVSSVSSRRGYTSRPPINPRFIKDLGNEVRFSSRIILYDTYSCDEYDRHPDTGTCNQLTPMLAQQIREELNELKRSMAVHEDSQCFTHFL